MRLLYENRDSGEEQRGDGCIGGGSERLRGGGCIWQHGDGGGGAGAGEGRGHRHCQQVSAGGGNAERRAQGKADLRVRHGV